MGVGKMKKDSDLPPHQEAIIAAMLHTDSYSRFEGGCMAFWDQLNPKGKTLCRYLADSLRNARQESEK
jgi:hypothetical protein